MLDKLLSFFKEKRKPDRITYSDGAYYITNDDKNPCWFRVMAKDTTKSMHYGLLPASAYDLDSFPVAGDFNFLVDLENNTVVDSWFDYSFQGRSLAREKLIEVLIKANILKTY